MTWIKKGIAECHAFFNVSKDQKLHWPGSQIVRGHTSSLTVEVGTFVPQPALVGHVPVGGGHQAD